MARFLRVGAPALGVLEACARPVRGPASVAGESTAARMTAAPDEGLGWCVGRDLVAASARLEAVEGRSEVDQTQLREAALALGQALLCRELYAPALWFFEASLGRLDTNESHDRALQKIEQSGYLPALRWLMLLSRRFPHWDDLLAAWGTYRRADIERPELADIRDELYYHLGRAIYAGGAPTLLVSAGHKPAAALLAQVAPSSPFYVKAKLLEGWSRSGDNPGPPSVWCIPRPTSLWARRGELPLPARPKKHGRESPAPKLIRISHSGASSWRNSLRADL